MKDQGEVALMIERDDRNGKIQIVGYVLPKNKKNFEAKELRDVYLAQAINNADVEDTDREKHETGRLNDRIRRKVGYDAIVLDVEVAAIDTPGFKRFENVARMFVGALLRFDGLGG